MIVVLDAGHGGIDPSGHYTTAPAKMFKHRGGEVAYEGVYNRIIAKLIEDKLTSKGLQVVRVYHDHIDTSLRDRAVNANKQSNAVFISIHFNASPNHKGRGFEVWTTRGQNNSDKLATQIFRSVFKSLEGTMRFRQDLKDGDSDFEAGFQVLRQCKHPSVLLECAFFDNEEDFKLMKDTNWQNTMSEAITKGILNYINEAK